VLVVICGERESVAVAVLSVTGAVTGFPEVISWKDSWPLGAVNPNPNTLMVAVVDPRAAIVVCERPKMVSEVEVDAVA
jgi:hypothetical protein